MLRKLSSVLPILLIASTGLAGCFVWSAVQSGYKNFSAYFNTYYNAQDAFNEAMTDVNAALKERDISIISGAPATDFVISANARQNFDLAIQHASKILQFYPTSSYVEDCLYMIGISYYYEGDNLRGGKKFLEAESAYPTGNRIPESLAYYGSILLREREYNAARDTLLSALQSAEQARDPKTAAMAAESMSDYYMTQGDTATAATYLDTAATFSTGDNAASLFVREGSLLSVSGQNRQAETAFSRAWDEARDFRLKFYSEYYLASALRSDGQYTSALGDLAEIRDDDKYFQFFPLIDYQRAKVLYDSGAVPAAVEEFVRIDTAFSSNEAATRSAYELGTIYMRLVGDYTQALKYFQKCTSHPAVGGVTPLAQQYSALLQEYLIDAYRLHLCDSSYAKGIEEIERKDSVATREPGYIDTLYEHCASAEQLLAGLFMFKLGENDSAVNHFRDITRHFKKSKVYPSALYTLGEYFMSNGDTARGTRYLDTLLAEHPESEYASAAKSVLGRPLEQASDSSEGEFSRADAMIDSGNYESAIGTLLDLSKNQKPQVAAKSLYTIGWIYENRKNELDSAAKYYGEVEKRFPATEFGSDVRLAVAGYEEAQKDSAAARVAVKEKVTVPERKTTSPDSSANVLRILQNRNERLDSLRTLEEKRVKEMQDSTAAGRGRGR